MNLLKYTVNKSVILVLIILFIIPLFWLKPGEMDLGGDSTRLYFYDPIHYLNSFPIYGLMPDSLSFNTLSYFLIPFVSLFIVLKSLLGSGWFFITLFNSFQLIAAFLSVYLIIKEFVNEENGSGKINSYGNNAGLIAGLFYALSPILALLTWGRALYIGPQFFLNPLMFLLLIKFFSTQNIRYLLAMLIVSFVFAQNFTPTPAFFSFYPFALLFSLLYTLFIKKKRISIQRIVLGVVLFLLIHSFHLAPQIHALFSDTNTYYSKFTFDGYERGITSFVSSLPTVSLLNNFFGVPRGADIPGNMTALWFLFPSIILFGLIVNAKNHSRLSGLTLLLVLFFLMVYFFKSAIITYHGLSFYKSLFYIPGFVMFRSFDGWFSSVYVFFLSLLIGVCIFHVLKKLSARFKKVLVIISVGVIFIGAVPLIRGDMTNIILNKGLSTKEFKVPTTIDPDYEKLLEYIRTSTVEGRIFSLPFNEAFYPLVSNGQNGVYLGPSMISYLTGKSDINGYQPLLPFSDTFLKLIQKKDYDSIKNLFSILNIKYFFHNADENIYVHFPDFPYRSTREALPPDKKSTMEFLSHFPVKKISEFGEKYYVYQLTDDVFLPKIYIPKTIKFFDYSKFFKNGSEFTYTTGAFYTDSNKDDRRVAYVETTDTKKTTTNEESKIPTLTITKINPTRYLIHVEKANHPYLLVFSESFRPQWELFISHKTMQQYPTEVSYFDGQIKETKNKQTWFNMDTIATWGEKPIAKERHIRVNGYSNAWNILPEDAEGKSEYTLILELSSQKTFYNLFIVSLLTILFCIVWLGKITIFNNRK